MQLAINRTIFGIETWNYKGNSIFSFVLSIEPFLELKLNKNRFIQHQR